MSVVFIIYTAKRFCDYKRNSVSLIGFFFLFLTVLLCAHSYVQSRATLRLRLLDGG